MVRKAKALEYCRVEFRKSSLVLVTLYHLLLRTAACSQGNVVRKQNIVRVYLNVSVITRLSDVKAWSWYKFLSCSSQVF